MSRVCRWMTVCAVAGLLIPAVVYAETLERGTVEFAPQVAFSHQSVSFDGENVGSLTQFQVDAFVGYCVSPMVEVGGGLIVNHSSIDPEGGGNFSATAAGVSGGVTLNFPSQGAVVPFVRGQVGAIFYSGDDYSDSNTTFLAPILAAGIRTMIGSSASVNSLITYAHHSSYQGVEDFSANEFGFGVGISVFPGR